MKKLFFLLLSLLFCSCNRLQSEATLAPADVAFIRAAAALDPGETIRCFYTYSHGRGEGCFVTDKRIGSYYVTADAGTGQYVRQSALFASIVKLEVEHESPLLARPYIGVHEKGNEWGFMVTIAGRHAEAQGFYDEALRCWRLQRHAPQGTPPSLSSNADVRAAGTGR
jgi:hypothetical protein